VPWGGGVQGDPGYRRGVFEPDQVITCIDCLGRAHLNGHPPEEGWQPGMLTMYRCEDCLDGWYLEVPDHDDH